MPDPQATPVPMLDLAAEVDELLPELLPALERVLRSGHFVLGPEVEAFEREVAAYLGVRHAVGLNSGTDALVIGLRALGVGPGDEVVTTGFSFFATAEAVATVGATPVYVDVDERTFNLDPDLLEAALGERTRAILPVHLYGRPAEMDRILEIARRHDLRVLEDCAQSFGAAVPGSGPPGRRTGALGDVGAYSFYPTKNLGAYGDGGLLATNDDETARLARMLRNHGDAGRYDNVLLGYNSRLDALQAAVLRIKLPRVDAWNEARRAAARHYGELLVGVPGVETPDIPDEHVVHQYTVRVPDGRRDAVADALRAQGIACAVYYPTTLAGLGPVASAARLPVAERLAREVLSLPVGPGIGRRERERVAAALRAALAAGGP